MDGLDPSVTAVMLRRVLDSIEDCRGQGVPSSIRLGLRVRAARRALRLDPALESTLPG